MWGRSLRQGRESLFEFEPQPIEDIKKYLDHVSVQNTVAESLHDLWLCTRIASEVIARRCARKGRVLLLPNRYLPNHFHLGAFSVARGLRLPCLSNVRRRGASVRRTGEHGTWAAYPCRSCSLPRSALSNRARLAANSRHRSSVIKRRPTSVMRTSRRRIDDTMLRRSPGPDANCSRR
jgi:hypothetical protein